MPTILLESPILTTILAEDGTPSGEAYALPAKVCLMAWQLSYDVEPTAISVTLQISLDKVIWLTIDTSTAVAGELRQITSPIVAKFIRAVVGTNGDDVIVTVQVMPNTHFSASGGGSGSNIPTSSGDYTIADSSGAAPPLVFVQAVTPEYYTIGELLHFFFDLTFPVTADGNAVRISLVGLPGNLIVDSCSNAVTFTDVGGLVTFYMDGNDCLAYKTDGTQYINSEFSGKTIVMAGIGRFSTE